MLTASEINKRTQISLLSLGIKSGATDIELKNAYRKLAKIHHPDKGGDEKTFKALSLCYSHLIEHGTRHQPQYKPHDVAFVVRTHSSVTSTTSGGATSSWTVYTNL